MLFKSSFTISIESIKHKEFRHGFKMYVSSSEHAMWIILNKFKNKSKLSKTKTSRLLFHIFLWNHININIDAKTEKEGNILLIHKEKQNFYKKYIVNKIK